LSLDSLRLRIEEVSRAQMEEVRRITDVRRAELEALREALEAESLRMREAQRALAEAERAMATARISEAFTVTSGNPFGNTNSNIDLNFGLDARTTLGTTTLFFSPQNQIPGAALISLNPDLARYFDVEAGVLITEIREGTPAAIAGLRPGDVVVRVGETSIASVEAIASAVQEIRAEQQPEFRTQEEAFEALQDGMQLRRQLAIAEDGGAQELAPMGDEERLVYNQIMSQRALTFASPFLGRLSVPLALHIVRHGEELEITLEP
jgi:hypothetical protein